MPCTSSTLAAEFQARWEDAGHGNALEAAGAAQAFMDGHKISWNVYDLHELLGWEDVLCLNWFTSYFNGHTCRAIVNESAKHPIFVVYTRGFATHSFESLP